MPLERQIHFWSRRMHQRLLQWAGIATRSLLGGTLTDLTRSTSELIAESALLRQQLVMLHQQVKRTACTRADRVVLVLFARATQRWKQALSMVPPDRGYLSGRNG